MPIKQYEPHPGVINCVCLPIQPSPARSAHRRSSTGQSRRMNADTKNSHFQDLIFDDDVFEFLQLVFKTVW